MTKIEKRVLAAFVLPFVALAGCGLKREIELKARIARLVAQLQRTHWRAGFSAGEHLGEIGGVAWEASKLIAGGAPK